MIKARELALANGWFQPMQFESEANAWIHKTTTGPELVRAFKTANLSLD